MRSFFMPYTYDYADGILLLCTTSFRNVADAFGVRSLASLVILIAYRPNRSLKRNKLTTNKS